MKNDYHAVDLFKFICSFFVIVVHTSPLLPFSYLGNFVLINIFGRVVVPFFFITSGFFVRRNTIRRGEDYFKSYIKTLIKIYIFWSLVYIPFGIQWIAQNFELPWFLYPFALIIAVLYIGTYFHLWYIPALIFSLVLVHWYVKKFSYRSLVIVGFILLCLGSLETYYGVISNKLLLDIIDNYMKVFVTTRNGLFFGIFYVTCGYYLAYDTPRSKFKNAGKLSLLFFSLLIVEAFSLYKSNSLNFNFLIMAAPFTVIFFQYLRTVKIKWKLNFVKIREYSNLYYFTHAMFLVLIPFVLSIFGRQDIFDDNGIFRLFSVWICTHLLSKLVFRFRSTKIGQIFYYI